MVKRGLGDEYAFFPVETGTEKTIILLHIYMGRLDAPVMCFPFWTADDADRDGVPRMLLSVKF